ncbi:catalase [Mycena crocata]|nr:catalase [Mycena crocata]
MAYSSSCTFFKFSLPLLLVTSFASASLANATLPGYTDGAGHPVSSPYDYQRDFHLIDLLSHFSRERIPERVVHAKGSGAHGYFEVTRDISNVNCSPILIRDMALIHFQITMAAPFSEGVGTKTSLSLRFSTVAGESGSPDTNRDPRGFAIKMRTSQGIWDWVFNNTPVFFLRDPTKFPLFIHSQKRDPETNLRSPTIQWDYWSQNQESVYQVMILFSNRGSRHKSMHGWSGHTYKWVKADGTWHYVKIKVISQQGIDNLSAEEALSLAATNPDHNTQDLRDRIAAGKFPTWHVAIQTMTPEEGQKYKYDVNDLTKVWPEDEFPLLEVGKIAEPSNDPVLQSRLFAYSDTARHRLGPNHLQIPVNCPLAVHNFERTLPPSAPNYPSSFAPAVSFPRRPYNLSSVADPVVGPATTLDFEQPNALYNKEFTKVEQQSLVANVVAALNTVTVEKVKQRSLDMFACVDASLGDKIGQGIGFKPSSPLFCGA